MRYLKESFKNVKFYEVNSKDFIEICKNKNVIGSSTSFNKFELNICKKILKTNVSKLYNNYHIAYCISNNLIERTCLFAFIDHHLILDIDNDLYNYNKLKFFK